MDRRQFHGTAHCVLHGRAVMGIRKIIGTALGAVTGQPWLGAVLGGAGQYLDDKQDRKRQAASDANSYVRMAEAARRAGLNPLEVLRAGNPTGVGRLPVGTTAAMQNQFDQIDKILTGEEARERRREDLQTDLLQIQKDTALAQLAAYRRPGLLSPGMAAGSVRTDQGPKVMSEIAAPTPVTETGDIDVTIDDGGTGVRIKPMDNVVTPNGSVGVTVGPDLDEMITGAAVNAAAGVRRMGLPSFIASQAPKPDSMFRATLGGGEDGKMRDLTFDYYTRNVDQKPPIQWDERFGYSKPDGWDEWSNKQKMAWITYNNRKR